MCIYRALQNETPSTDSPTTNPSLTAPLTLNQFYGLYGVIELNWRQVHQIIYITCFQWNCNNLGCYIDSSKCSTTISSDSEQACIVMVITQLLQFTLIFTAGWKQLEVESRWVYMEQNFILATKSFCVSSFVLGKCMWCMCYSIASVLD